MKIRFKDIGIIGESEIELSGLTVIAGRNNSGKTTAGKVLFSLFDAVTDINRKLERDKEEYIRSRLYRLSDDLSSFRPLFEMYPSRDYEAFSHLFSDEFLSGLTADSGQQYLERLRTELMWLNIDECAKRMESLSPKNNPRIAHEMGHLLMRMESQKNAALSRVMEALKRLSDALDRDEYARKSIEQTLNREFAGQTQPVDRRVEFSEVEVLREGATPFRIRIQDNKVLKDSFSASPVFQNVYLLDDPFLCERPAPRSRTRFSLTEIAEIIHGVATHWERLRGVLFESELTVLEQVLLEKDLHSILEKINGVLPGEFEASSEGLLYVTKEYKLNFSNLAAGSKVFATVKMLLEKGKLGEETLLIFDEPEVHLHPERQNLFAEVIVLLVKLLKTTVLLTTHSPNFMLAIDACMRKHELNDVVNFYRTEKNKAGTFVYRCVNDHLESIYADFVAYLSEMKAMRDRYLDPNWYEVWATDEDEDD